MTCFSLGQMLQEKYESKFDNGISFINGETEEKFVTYKELYLKSRKILYYLQTKGIRPGNELLLQLKENEEYLYVFWACILGGIIPVPVSLGNSDEHKLKVYRIWKRLNKAFLITDKINIEKIIESKDSEGFEEVINEIKTSAIFIEDALETELMGEIHNNKDEDIAFVQFSSGSTGEAKGVVLSHKNIIQNIRAMAERAEIDEKDSMLSWMPLTHDMGLICIHLTGVLKNINQYIMPTTLFVRRPVLWIEKANEHKPSLLFSPNFGYKHFLSFLKDKEKNWDLSSVRLIFNGAEPISHKLANEFMDRLERYGLRKNSMYMVYGLAEASVAVSLPKAGSEVVPVNLNREFLSVGDTVKECAIDDKENLGFVEVGSSINYCNLRICDEENNELKDDVVGYIQISGDNVTKAYYNNSEATEKAILADGWVNTGDLGFLRDGNLVITGRAKDIIFVNGQNYYSHDIERVAESIDGVELGRIAVASCFNDKTASEEIYAFVLFKKKMEEFIEVASELKDQINQKLGIVFKEVVPVKKMLKTTSGKIQRYKMLQRYTLGEYDSIIEELNQFKEKSKKISEFDKPRNEIERKIHTIWSEILNINEIGVYQNFFELGGSSLTILQVIEKIDASFAIEMGIAEFSEEATIAKISEKIISNLSNPNIEKRTGNNGKRYKNFEADNEKMYEGFPLTQVQKAYLMGRAKEFEIGGISTHFYMEYETELNIERFNQSFNKVIKKHPMLRAIFVSGNEQRILKDVADYNIVIEDISKLEKRIQENYILEERNRMSHDIFDSSKWPLFEIKAFKLNENKKILCMGFDLLIADAGSFEIMGRDLFKFYKNPELEEKLDFSFRDYLLAYEDFKNTDTYIKDKEYWLNKLEDFPSAPQLSLKKKASEIESPKFKQKKYLIEKDKWKKLKKVFAKKALTPSAVLCTAYAEVMAFWSNQKNLAINLTVFNRYPFNKEVNEIIGDFTSVILLGINLKEDNEFWGNAKEVQKTLMEDLEHRHYEGVEFSREISRKTNSGTKALMPIVFTSMLHENEKGILDEWTENGEIKATISQTSQVFIDNQISELNGNLVITWDYVEDLFEKEVIDLMFDQYTETLCNLSEDKEDKTLYPLKNDIEIIENYNNTEENIPETTLLALFNKTFIKYPNNIALEYKERTMTYKELNYKSNQIAHFLKKKGVGKNDFVGILATREIETIVNLMGIIKAGAAYVPIDPEYPDARKEYIMSNSAAKYFIKPDVYLKEELVFYPTDLPEDISETNDIAYIIYTSGSTGKPKGVIISHKEVANTIIDINQRFNVGEEDRIIGLSSMCFDLSVYDIFGALSTGARLVLISNQRDAGEIIDVMKSKKITFWNSVPAIMDMLTENIDKDYKGEDLKKVLLSGDWIGLNLPKKIKNVFPNAEITSLGGATEASIWSIYYPINQIMDNWKSIPYGYPLSNQQFYVLNYKRELCPIGVSGELWIGGKGVANGYMNDKEKTDAAFVEDPKFGRIYKTGDYGVLHKEGYIEFMGRKDLQVKIRGYRIELGEIETCLNEFLGIKTSLVIDKTDENGKRYLCAYYVSDEKQEKEKLKTFLQKKLPDYMMPSYFIKIEEIPLTANGKVNKKVLPEPEIDLNSDTFQEYRNETEKGIVEVWREVLGVEKIGINDNFFELGGDSLQIYQVVMKVEERFEVKVPLQEMYKQGTVSFMASFIEKHGKKEIVVEKEEDKTIYYWSPNAHWQIEGDEVKVEQNYYKRVDLFPKLYFIAQKGVSLSELKNEFLEVQDIGEFLENLVKDKVLINSLLNPEEIFMTQKQLFKSNFEDVIKFDSEKYNKFKNEQLNRTLKVSDGQSTKLEIDWEFPKHISERKTHREFNTKEKFSFEDLAKLLSVFKQYERDGKKSYYYASAGGLYPIDVFVYVKEDRVENVKKGLYYYNPLQNSIDLVNAEDEINKEAHYFRNKAIFESSAVSVFLVYNAEVNMPIYEGNGYYFACLDAGIMLGTMTSAAEVLDIGLCSIGDMDSKKILPHFKLNKNQVLLHTVEIGKKL